MKILLSLFLVFLTASVFGYDANVRPSWSGSWFNPDQSGHGINVEFLDEERTIFYWYTYDQDGKPFWLLAQGFNSPVWLGDGLIPWPVAIRVEATAYYYEGMMFGEFDPATNNGQEWGTIVLDFHYDSCNVAHMEWYPVMAGFSQGSTWLRRLTTLYDLDCVYQFEDTAGNWEVQFGFDAGHKYQVELVADPDTELRFWTFEFFDETDCLWSGRVGWGFGLRANWGNQCGATAEEHSSGGSYLFEYRLCNSENDCVRKDQVMTFEDDGMTLIFSR